MNKAEFKAIKKIAEKLNWKSVNFETIKQMVRNQQALELDTVGECDDAEETLLSIALWDRDKIVSTMYVNDYESLVMWGVYCFCDDMGITPSDYASMLTYYNRIQPEIFEQEEYEIYLEEKYWEEIQNDYYFQHRMGWV